MFLYGDDLRWWIESPGSEAYERALMVAPPCGFVPFAIHQISGSHFAFLESHKKFIEWCDTCDLSVQRQFSNFRKFNYFGCWVAEEDLPLMILKWA